MYKLSLSTLIVLCSFVSYSKENSELFFIENKGQITDQFQNLRSDIQFSLQSQSMNLFIGNGAMHYQFTRSNNAGIVASNFMRLAAGARAPAANIETYRMDVELVGANKNASVITENRQAYYEHYYLPQCPNGVAVHSFKKITYKDIYPGIDWVIYIRDNKLEHDFVVKQGGKPTDIRLRYSGASSLTINKDGTLAAVTPFGTISEAAPVTYEASGKKVNTSFILKDGVV